jgi:N4-gp56 family major capsid protein
MTNTSVDSSNQVDQWSNEWNRADQFARFTGEDSNKVVQVKRELEKSPGDDLTFSFVGKLNGAGVTGDNELQTNEENLDNYGYKVTVDQLRNAVVVGKMEQQKTHIDLLNAAKPQLKAWRVSKHRDDVIAALLSPNVDGTTAYASCSESNKDAWETANDGTVNRVLFGSAVGNASADHSADLAKVDSTNDTLDSGILSLAHRLMKSADPHFTPIQVDGFGEYFVCFAGSLGFRDLLSDSVISNAQQYAMQRGKGNPLFNDADVLWKGMIVKEVPEIDVISSVGASSIDVEPCFFCGAQALGYAIAEETHAITREDDYGNLKGVGVADIVGVQKLMFNSIQNGVLTCYVSGVADS